MIKFFRKIRQKLLTENKFSKYLLYAIGEILLVVLGILIALQINNWNTNKLEKKELYSYLINVKNNLHSDLNRIREIKTFRDSTIIFSDNFLKIAKKDKITFEDFYTVAPIARYNAFIDQHLKSHRSGFEILKNSGYLGKLNGTELEKRLNEYYYLLDEVREREISLHNNIETMENVAFENNIRQQMIELQDKNVFLSTNQGKIKTLINHSSLTGVNIMNQVFRILIEKYVQLEELANIIITDIEKFVRN